MISQPLSPLQAAHAAARARAAKIASREPGVLSIYALGEAIARIEEREAAAAAAGDYSAMLALAATATDLKSLLPIR